MGVRTSLVAGLLGVCVLTAPGYGQQKKKAAAKPVAVAPPEVDTWVLDNGLSVAHVHRPGTPVVSVQVWYRAGTADEPDDKRGVSRLFETLMFSGSDRVRPGDHTKFVESTGGYADAFVLEDAAAYNNTVPLQHMDRVLELEAERMRSLVFTAEMIKSAKAGLSESIRRSQASPFYMALVELMDEAFSKHPYKRTSATEVSDLKGISLADIKRFYGGYYVPGNALLIVVGAAKTDAVREAVEKHFGKIEAGKVADRPSKKAEPAQKKARRRLADGEAPVGFVVVGHHIPEAKHKDIYDLQVLSLLLARGDSARLKKTFDKDKNVRGASAEALVREHPGLFVVYAANSPGSDAAAVEKQLIAELSKLTRLAPSAKEVSRAKRQLSSGLALGLDQITGMARQVGQSWVLTGDPAQFLSDIAEFEKVTPKSIVAAAKKYFSEESRSVVIIRPAGARR